MKIEFANRDKRIAGLKQQIVVLKLKDNKALEYYNNIIQYLSNMKQKLNDTIIKYENKADN